MLRLSQLNLNGHSLSVLFEWNVELFGRLWSNLGLQLPAAIGLKAYTPMSVVWRYPMHAANVQTGTH